MGRTGLVVEKQGFGCLPIQRISKAEAVELLHRAYDGGMNYFDTARAYSDSEEKVGAAFAGMRDRVILATKTAALTADGFWKDLETSLRTLGTGYIDVYQFHNPAFCPRPGGADGLYDAALEAKRQGKIRHIGVTAHKMDVAKECIESGLYETLQYPLSYLSSEKELELVELCRERNMGFIAMKGLAGGLLTNSRAASAFMSQFDHVLPLWGVQRMEELEEWLEYMEDAPVLDEELAAFIEKEKKELTGEFCRGCGYCMPCPAGIVINNCARMSLMVRRAPSAGWLSEEWQEKMKKIEGCMQCGQCRKKCPYELDTPNLLKKNYEDYQKILAGKITV